MALQVSSMSVDVRCTAARAAAAARCDKIKIFDKDQSISRAGGYYHRCCRTTKRVKLE